MKRLLNRIGPSWTVALCVLVITGIICGVAYAQWVFTKAISVTINVSCQAPTSFGEAASAGASPTVFDFWFGHSQDKEVTVTVTNNHCDDIVVTSINLMDKPAGVTWNMGGCPFTLAPGQTVPKVGTLHDAGLGEGTYSANIVVTVSEP